MDHPANKAIHLKNDIPTPAITLAENWPIVRSYAWALSFCSHNIISPPPSTRMAYKGIEEVMRMKPKPLQERRLVPVSRVFDCILCNNEKCVVVKRNKKKRTGSLKCDECGRTYRVELKAGYTIKTADVFRYWIHAIHEMKKKEGLL
ncbi:hypothetical protein K470DRAFT_279270 [Piedraia hortae CBS 480.64]|uniref:Transcription elongation factor 1 homolog n=1 Tax=Piedraia hortae CBS 480.64 TaxID=1314780 RepID=A0A6A7BQD8_9PEZI|nr:hypothetical protein K470DRAFT_279270 [Piedraia hortae CBS 480.64]